MRTATRPAPFIPSQKVFTFRSTRAMFRHYLVKAKWVEFALQLHEGMVTAMKHGDGLIHATVEDVADWGGCLSPDRLDRMEAHEGPGLGELS